ncbi:MAG: DUF167 domain-containing protein [Candidatus Paceibacterota bacterium]
MFLTILTKLNKKKEGVEKTSDTEFIVWTKQPATENKANEDVMKQLAKYFKMPKSKFSIIRGKTVKTKTIKIV